jgi:hypothetical protein
MRLIALRPFKRMVAPVGGEPETICWIQVLVKWIQFG